MRRNLEWFDRLHFGTGRHLVGPYRGSCMSLFLSSLHGMHIPYIGCTLQPRALPITALSAAL